MPKGSIKIALSPAQCHNPHILLTQIRQSLKQGGVSAEVSFKVKSGGGGGGVASAETGEHLLERRGDSISPPVQTFLPVGSVLQLLSLSSVWAHCFTSSPLCG